MIYEQTNSEHEYEHDINELNDIQMKIENMTKFNQIEVLRILNKNANIILNENKNGIYVNLTELSSSVIEDLKKYINYVNNQEIILKQREQEKEIVKNIYFTKEIKDN